MKKSLFTIYCSFAFLCINISPSLSMDSRENNLANSFWNSLPGNFMSLGGDLENDLKNNEQEYENFTILPPHNGRRPGDEGFISGLFMSDSTAICTPCTSPPFNPVYEDFCKYLETQRKTGGDPVTIGKFYYLLDNNPAFKNSICIDITKNSYPSLYLNYLSAYRGFK